MAFKFQFTTDAGVSYTDDSANVTDNNLGTFSTLNSLDTVGNGDWVVIGDTVQVFKGVTVTMGNTNSNAAVATLEYWNGSAWTALSGVTDGTISAGKTFGQTGLISWTIPGGWATSSINSITAYWIRYSTSAAFDASVTVTEVDSLIQLEPTAIASAEAFGTLTVTSLATISPTAIASAEAFGTITRTSVFTVSPTAISSSESFGDLTIANYKFICPATTPFKCKRSGVRTCKGTKLFAPSCGRRTCGSNGRKPALVPAITVCSQNL